MPYSRQELENLIQAANNPAIDFDGVTDSGRFGLPKPVTIITARDEGQRKETEEEIEKMGLTSKVKELVMMKENVGDDKQAKAKFKAEAIKRLSIDLFIEDDPKVVFWINSYLKDNNSVKIVYLNALHYVIFSYYNEGLMFAEKLIQEGNDVVIAMLTPEDVGKKADDKELEKRRQKTGEGIVKKYSSKEMLKFLKAVSDEDKNEYFIVWDFNWAPEIAEQVEVMGFAGLYPHKIDREMEEDREIGQKIVKENYKLLQPPEEQEFKSIEDALKVIEETENLWVIKPNNDELTCYIPVSEDIEMFKKEAKSFLENEKQELEKDGFIMQEKILQPVEVCGEALWYDGKPVWFTADIEYKKKGAGNTGCQVGCAGNLVYILNENSKLVKIALKDYEPIAEKRKLTNFMDASVLIDRKTNKYYFGEYCPSRPGWAAFVTELSMLPSVSYFFECVKNRITPNFDKKYGFAIPIFNDNTNKERYSQEDLSIQVQDPNNVWLTNVYKNKEGEIMTTAMYADTCYVTGQGDTAEEAIKSAEENLKNVAFKDMYYRSDYFEKEKWFGILFEFDWLEKNGYN
jgi:phosphoribosylamine-glycine ligase